MGDTNELNVAIAAINRAIAEKQRELKTLLQTRDNLVATAKLFNPAGTAVSTEYTGKTISEAYRLYLKELGRAASTREIADGLLSKGLQTSSKNFPMTVYTILREDKNHIRRTEQGLWELKESKEQ